MEKISVIIPVYNVEPYIRQCLDSIINQTYKNLEIIIIDDGSPDGCGAICDEYAKKDSRIIVIHKENEGLCAARNDGIKQATGEWVAFVDSDDWCELDYYENMMNSIMNEDIEMIIAGGYYSEFQGKSSIVRTFEKPLKFIGRDNIETLMIKTLISGKRGYAYGYPWDRLYKALFIKNHDLYFDTDQKAWEDCCFNFRFLNEAKCIIENGEIGYHYRRNEISITKGYNVNKPWIMYDVIVKMRNYATQKELNKRLLHAINQSSILAIATIFNNYYFHPANPKTNRQLKEEIIDMKKWPYFYEAIWEEDNQYLSKHYVVLKYTLRIPWLWPIKLLYIGKKILDR